MLIVKVHDGAPYPAWMNRGETEQVLIGSLIANQDQASPVNASGMIENVGFVDDYQCFKVNGPGALTSSGGGGATTG